MSLSRSWRLSPLAEFVEDRTDGGATRYGIFHRLTGESLSVSGPLREILLCLRDDAASGDYLELLRQEPAAREALGRLEAGHFLVPSLGAGVLLRPFLDHRLLLPAMNPAITFRRRDGRMMLIRLKESHVCRLPRDETAPQLVEEMVPGAAAELLSHAAGNRTLRETVEQAAEGKAKARAREVWAALDWLCDATRQLIRGAPAAADLRAAKQPVHYLIQNLIPIEAPSGHAQAEAQDAASFYQEQVSDADWNFDWVEPTVCHSFRYPTGALSLRAYGEQFCESVFEMLGPGPAGFTQLDVLEVGGGTGSFARAFLHQARGFVDRFEQIGYTMLDCSPAMLDRQRRSLADVDTRVQHVEQDAHEFRLPAQQFRLIIANEMIADLSAKRDAPAGSGASDSWLHAGVFSFLERVWEHLSPGGLAILTEYGGINEPVRPVAHLNHPEYSIDFAAVMRHAERLGFHPSLRPLSDFLNVSEQTEMLCGQQERYLCLNRLLGRRGRQVPYAAFCRQSFEQGWGDIVADLGVGGLQFAPLAEGLHFGPELRQFWALILRKGS